MRDAATKSNHSCCVCSVTAVTVQSLLVDSVRHDLATVTVLLSWSTGITHAMPTQCSCPHALSTHLHPDLQRLRMGPVGLHPVPPLSGTGAQLAEHVPFVKILKSPDCPGTNNVQKSYMTEVNVIMVDSECKDRDWGCNRSRSWWRRRRRRQFCCWHGYPCSRLHPVDQASSLVS